MSWTIFRENIQAIRKARRRYREAKRTYRALCREGRAPMLRFDVRLDPNDLEWQDLKSYGITGIKTTLPLTPKGERYIRRSVRKIRETCIRDLVEIARKDEQP